jgi:putative membrane protein
MLTAHNPSSTREVMMGGFEMGFMWIILIIIIVAAVLLTKGYLSPAKKEGEPPRESPLDILKKRYARGEISKQEFEERKKDLI